MVVCITGDSIGESFAMKEANVGLTMKNSGTDFSKSACDIILNDNLRIIIECMKYGRNLVENVRRFVQF